MDAFIKPQVTDSVASGDIDSVTLLVKTGFTKTKEVYFNVTGASQPLRPSPALHSSCQLFSCMSMEMPLTLPDGMDPLLAANLPKIVKLLAKWNPSLKSVPILRSALGESRPPAGGVAACFTGGVDSFYTLITRRAEIDTLIYVLGFDLQSKQATLWNAVRAMLEKVAVSYGKRLVIVETNLRAVLDPILPWGMTHGTALAAVAHLLAGEIRKFIIPSSFAAGHLHPWGSHPELDPLWSLSHLEIVHDAVSATRLEKLRMLVEEQTPLQSLRVCWENPEEAYNCGVCAKCFRTMAGLKTLGDLERATTFTTPLNLDAAAKLDLGDETDGIFLREIRDELVLTQKETALAALLGRLPGVSGQPGKPFSVLRAANTETVQPLIIQSALLEVTEQVTRLKVPVIWGELKTQLEIEFNLGGKFPTKLGDALLLWFILPAMRHRVPLILEDSVSPELLESIEQAQGVWATHSAFKGHHRVEITAPPAAVDEMAWDAKQKPWASAFSSGVDAQFTALMEKDRIQYLVWIDGIDTEAIDASEQGRMQTWLTESAAVMGKQLVLVKSNLRRVLMRELGLGWQFMYVMSPYGLAHLMQPHISRFLLAAEVNYREMFSAHATLRYNPVLDRMLSTRRMRIKLHGMTHSRFEKVAQLANHPELLNQLIVCQQRAVRGFAGGRNCGRCEKCLRTLAAIRMAGANHPAEAFDQPLDLKLLSEVGSTVQLERFPFYGGMLKELELRGSDPELTEAIREVVRRGERRLGATAATISPLEALRLDPDWPTTVQKNATLLATAAISDKPSSRLRSMLNDPPAPGFPMALMQALTSEQGRWKMFRSLLGRTFKLKRKGSAE